SSLLDAEEPPALPALRGKIEDSDLTALFARLATERATGRLAVARGDHARVTVHVAGGSPTYVGGNLPGLQLPNLLVRQGLVPAPLLSEVMSEVLAREQPIAEVLSRRAGLDLALLRPTLMRARLVELFRWR